MKRPDILIVKLSAIGDVVHTLPALNAIRHCYPGAHIDWLVEEAAADLIIGHRALDQVFIAQRKTWLSDFKTADRGRLISEIARFIQTLRSRRYDMVFDFQFSLKGALWIAMTRARRKIGFGPGLEHQEHSHLVLNERIPAVSMEVHALERGLQMLKAVGIEAPQVSYQLPITPEHIRQAERLLMAHGISSQRPFVAVNPMAKWETKLWEIDKFAKLVDIIQDKFKLPVVFTGGPEDRAYIDTIRKQMKTAAPNLAGRTSLLSLAALLQQAQLMVTTDTGPMHIAAAVDTPTIAVFGPTAPWRTGPYGQQHQVIVAHTACAPCFKRTCPLPEIKKCMKDITVTQVVAALENKLQ